MEFVKVWGNLLANYVVGQTVCAIPTTYFVQGTAEVQIVNSCVNGVSDTDSSSSIESGNLVSPDVLESTNESSGNHQEIIANEEKIAEFYKPGVVDESIEDELGICENDNEEETSKTEKRIKRIRYSREEYKCTICPYTCTTEKAFLRHLRGCEAKEWNSHQHIEQEQPRLSCPICGKDRNSEQSLELHMKKHKIDKHFCCDICNFKSLQLKKLIQHRRMHTGERPHLCPFCSYRSARRDNLRSHVRRVHKKDNLLCDTFTPRSMLLTPSKNKS